MTPSGEPREMVASRYELRGQIGWGGMAVVHRGWDTVLRREVAVKIMHQLVLDPSARARFEAEGATLARLDHPALTFLFDAGTHEDQPFLVMELIDGVTLSEHCRRRAPRLPRWPRSGRPWPMPSALVVAPPEHPWGDPVPETLREFLAVCQRTCRSRGAE